MGYMGLESYGCSDGAFDAAWTAIDAMVKSLEENLDTDKGNCYNTCGIVNVALFFEAFIIPNGEFVNSYTSLHKLAKKTLKQLKKKIKQDDKRDWGDTSNKKMHMDAYNRMADSLRSWIAKEL